MKIIKRIMCKHDYKFTGKSAWIINSHNQFVMFRIYKCKKCGHETKIDAYGREITFF